MPVNETVEVGAARVALPPPIAPSLPFHVAATTSADQPVQQQDAQEQAMQLPDQTTSSPSKVDSVSVPSAVRVGNRTVFTSKLPRQWSWKAFTSSARGDGVQFRHWVRANVEYSDYPYARFDVNLNPLSYTDDGEDTCKKEDVQGGHTRNESLNARPLFQNTANIFQ